jgi:branched-chain amino acid transport system permease protein
MSTEIAKGAQTGARQANEKNAARVRAYIWAAIVAFAFIIFMPIPSMTPNLSFAFYLMLWITMATSFNFAAGLTGYMPFGYVAFYGAGAYATGILYKTMGLPIGVALLGAAVAGCLISLVLAPTLRLRGVYFGIVSLGLAMAMKLTVSLLPDDLTGGSMGLILTGANDPQASFYTMLGIMLLALVVGGWLAMSRTGIALKAIRDDAEAASVIGINVPLTRLKAWVMAAIFPALVGGVEAWYTNAIDLEASFNLLVTAKSIVYAMAGGLGFLIGPVLGATVLYAVDQVIWQIFPLLNLLFLGLVIIALMIGLPRGIVGVIAQRFPQIRRFIP